YRWIAEKVLRVFGEARSRDVNDWITKISGIEKIELNVTLKNFPVGVGPLRLAFLSDFHVGPSTGPLVLQKAFQIVSDWEPDLILLGGDYVFFSADYAQELATLLYSCSPRFGIFAGWGNHDWAAGRMRISRLMSEANVRFLRNESIALSHPYDKIWIAVVDDASEGYLDTHAALRRVEHDACMLLLSHNPDGIMRLGTDKKNKRPDLVLSGHTHGGQICLPGGQPIVMPCQLGRRFPGGLFETEWGRLYVSRGVGCGGVPFRLFAPPEVALLTLEAGSAGADVNKRSNKEQKTENGNLE
ncbi:MAG: metallophosphoesterase, partial [Pseudomonadota bacterium]